MIREIKETTLLAQGGQGRNVSGSTGSVSKDDYDMSTARRQGPFHGRVTDGVWYKRAKRSKHMLRMPTAWAVDLYDLECAERCGAVALELRETEQGVTYRVSLKTLRERGQVIDRRFGRQIMLPLGYWQTGATATLDNEPRQGVLW